MSAGEGQALSFIYLAGCLVMIVSALAVRRIPMRQGLKMGLAWLMIFFAAFVVFTLKDDFLALGSRVLGEARGDTQTRGAAGELRIRKADDGHFWARGRINGEDVLFLVDSGATVTSISAETARRAGIDPASGFPVAVNTANGRVTAQRTRTETIAVGGIERADLAVHVSTAFGETNVLGMNFLSSLSGWSVEGEWLLMKP